MKTRLCDGRSVTCRLAVGLLLWGALVMHAVAQQSACDALLSPSANPMPPAYPGTIEPNDLLRLRRSSTEIDPAALNEYRKIEKALSSLEEAVYETNHFLAKLHNYPRKVTEWWRQTHPAEDTSLMAFIESEKSRSNGPTNLQFYGTLRGLLHPVCALELLDDPDFSDLVLESERLKLNPTFPTMPPVTYMCDGLLGHPAATNLALRFPSNSTPTKLQLHVALLERVEMARQMIGSLVESRPDLTTDTASAIKWNLKYNLVAEMAGVCHWGCAPQDLRNMLNQAKSAKGRLHLNQQRRQN